MESWQSRIAVGVGCWIAVNTLSFFYQVARGATGEVERPVEKVSVVLPALYEDVALTFRCVESLRNQTVVKAFPELFEFIAVGDPYADGYLSPLAVFFDRIIGAPYGKLKARHAGISAASGEIIVAVDADCVYPPMWLNNILKPFKDPNVVAVTCPTIFVPFIVEPFANIPKTLFYMTKISGRASAFRKTAYFAIGGFDLSINEFSEWGKVVWEEEYNFKKKLSEIGKVAYVNTPVYTEFRKSTPSRVQIHQP